MDDQSMKTMFSSKSDDWTTPRQFFDTLNDEFHFDIDGAATKQNALCSRYYGIDNGGRGKPECLGDALTGPWAMGSSIFINPPYSMCKEFIAKAAQEQQANNVLSVLLIPARTDTRWFHQYVWDEKANAPRPNVSVRFIKGRLKFGGGTNSAPFPSMLVVFHRVA